MERDRERGKTERSSIYWFIPQIPVASRASTGCSQEPEVPSGPPPGMHRLKYLGHRLPPPRHTEQGSWT